MPPETILPFSPADAGTSATLKSGPEAAAAPAELLASLPQEHIETASRLGLALKLCNDKLTDRVTSIALTW